MATYDLSLRSIGYVILYCRDVLAAAKFYRDQLGIPVRFEDAEWTELDTEGLTLALHRSIEAPVRSQASPCVTFRVDDVRAAHHALQDRGVEVGQLKKVHDAGPMVGVAADLVDPEGNRLSVYGLVPAAEWKA